MTPRPGTIVPDHDGRPDAAAARPDSPVICRRRLGTDLRRLRQEHHLRLEDAAAPVGVTPSALSRIEVGVAPTRVSYLTVLLDLYGVRDAGQRALMTEMALRGHGKDWWAHCADLLAPATCRYLSLEATASHVRVYSALAVPGLLQTVDYAAAAYRASRPDLTPHQTARLVAWHASRQEPLRRDGIQIHLVIDKAALIRPLAPDPVLKG